MRKKLGAYIHIPYCVSKCDYCSFCSIEGQPSDEYVDALVSEIELRAPSFSDYQIDTLYFGGGTPSLLQTSQLEKILNALSKGFSLSLTEFTIEANPGTVTRQKAEGYRSLGVNRVSLGLQSSKDALLRSLGRIHSYMDFLDAIDDLWAAGIDNISCDLLLGIKRQSVKQAVASIDAVTLRVKHVSCYALKVEEGTVLYETGFKPNEDRCADMYEAVCSGLQSKGFMRYEVSNFALDGYECAHNKKYWNLSPYIGLGVSAHSFFNNNRFANSENIKEYISGNFDMLNLGQSDLEEFVMLSLRTSQGLNAGEFDRRFPELGGFFARYSKQIERLKGFGLIECCDGGICLSDKGWYVMNKVILEFI